MLRVLICTILFFLLIKYSVRKLLIKLSTHHSIYFFGRNAELVNLFSTWISQSLVLLIWSICIVFFFFSTSESCKFSLIASFFIKVILFHGFFYFILLSFFLSFSFVIIRGNYYFLWSDIFCFKPQTFDVLCEKTKKKLKIFFKNCIDTLLLFFVILLILFFFHFISFFFFTIEVTTEGICFDIIDYFEDDKPSNIFLKKSYWLNWLLFIFFFLIWVGLLLIIHTINFIKKVIYKLDHGGIKIDHYDMDAIINLFFFIRFVVKVFFLFSVLFWFFILPFLLLNANLTLLVGFSFI